MANYPIFAFFFSNFFAEFFLAFTIFGALDPAFFHLRHSRSEVNRRGQINSLPLEGAEIDALQRRVSVTSGADALIVQAIGAAAIEEWMDAVEDDIRQELEPGEELVPRFSPGYGDLPLECQRTLVSVLDTPRKIGVSLTDTLLMVPSKSVSAIIGVRMREGA